MEKLHGKEITKGALICITVLTNPAYSITFAEVAAKQASAGVDSVKYNEILGKEMLEWDALPLPDKAMSAKGTIIGMDMETADDPVVFATHTGAVVSCMDTQGHGMNLKVSVKIMIGLMQCASTTYRKYCTICKP